MNMNKEYWENEIKTLQILLQDALEIEHATIPPYFTAMLSLKPGYNEEVREIIRSVLIEEMLHLTLAANLLNAMGGKPDLSHPEFVPCYPHNLPHSGEKFLVHIEAFSESALKTFMKIEHPVASDSPPEGEGFHSIAQFYASIRKTINEICDFYGEEKLFIGNINLQIRPEDYYGAGSVVVVHNRETAMQAIETIVEQGEGAHETIFDHDHNILGDGEGYEIAHYYRFKEIEKGKRYTQKDTPKSGPHGKELKVNYKQVYQLQKDIKISDFPDGTPIRRALEEFAFSYRQLLLALEASFNGKRTHLTEAIARMFAIQNQANSLIRNPSGNGDERLGLDFRMPD